MYLDGVSSSAPTGPLVFDKQTPRFPLQMPPNGNIRTLVPDIDNQDVFRALLPFHKVNTTTRCVFNNDKIYDVPNTLADKVQSPGFRNSAPRQSGHVAMNQVASLDPRQQHVPPSTGPEVGPGCYAHDPLGDHTTGMPDLPPGQSHAMLAFAKHKARPSPVFKSPERDETALAKAQQRLAQVHHPALSPPDYASWTSKGWALSRQPRWRHSVPQLPSPAFAVPAPIPASLASPSAASLTSPHSTSFPSQGSTRSHDRSSCGGHPSFASHLPRLMALHASDTRVVAKNERVLSGTPDSLGPGAYACDLPRLRSPHAALQSAPAYRSLAASAQQVPQQAPAHSVQRASTAARVSASASPAVQPRSPSPIAKMVSKLHEEGLLSSTPLPPTPSHLQQTSGRPSSVAMPAEQGGESRLDDASAVIPTPIGVDPDWLVHQALVALSFAHTEETRGAATISKRRGAALGAAGPISPMRAEHLKVQVAQDLAQVAAGLHKSPTYPSPTTSQPLQPPPSPARLASPTRVPQLHTTITLSETHTPAATKQPGSYSLHDPSQDVNAICMAAAPHPVATPPRYGGLAGSHIDQEPIAALVLAGVSSQDIIGGTGVSTAVQARATEPLIMASALSPQPSHRLRPVATAPSSLKSAVSGAHLKASRPKFDRLVFNKRLTSHASLIHSRIAANTDLASARVALRKEVVG